jgi:hypothetical protein
VVKEVAQGKQASKRKARLQDAKLATAARQQKIAAVNAHGVQMRTPQKIQKEAATAEKKRNVAVRRPRRQLEKEQAQTQRRRQQEEKVQETRRPETLALDHEEIMRRSEETLARTLETPESDAISPSRRQGETPALQKYRLVQPQTTTPRRPRRRSGSARVRRCSTPRAEPEPEAHPAKAQRAEPEPEAPPATVEVPVWLQQTSESTETQPEPEVRHFSVFDDGASQPAACGKDRPLLSFAA